MSAPRWRFAALGSALFIYLTAELFPIGALPELSQGLGVSTATTGLLLTTYAVVAGVATLPAIRLTKHLDRRTVLVAAMVLLAVSQVGLACAPTFTVSIATRVVGALAHGLLWSQIPIVATRFVAPQRAGRAVATVFLGTSAGLVSGVPLTTGLVQLIGWRPAAMVLAFAALAVATALCSLPPLPATTPATGTTAHTPWRPILAVCAVTVALVVGNQISYTYLALIVGAAGLGAALLVPTLVGFGLAGLVGVTWTGRRLDAHPLTTAAAVGVFLTLGLAAFALSPGRIAGAGAVLLWGAGAAALPVVLQAAALRVAGRATDLASGAYVVAYQIGISAGAATGATLITLHGIPALPVTSALVTAGATLCLVAIIRSS